MREIKFYEAIKESQTQLMMRDKSIVTMGLGINDPKGIFGTTKDLNKIFGNKRVLETPTSENAITGIAVGGAIMGLRPIITHQRVEFSLLSMEQIINQAAKWYFLSGGKYKVPIVIRLIIGKGWGQGPQHSQSLEALFSHIPGLKVVSPSNLTALVNLTVSVNVLNPVMLRSSLIPIPYVGPLAIIPSIVFCPSPTLGSMKLIHLVIRTHLQEYNFSTNVV